MGNEKKIGIASITIVASLGGFLFGFDMAVISGVLPLVKKQFYLNPLQEGWFVSAALVGCIIGVAFSGELCDRIGRKGPLLLSAALFLLSAVGCFILPSLHWVIAARLLGGIGIGIASNVVPLYIAEIAPASIRGRLVTFYQLALTFGILVAYLTNAALLSYAAQATGYGLFKNEIWRWMFGAGAVPALLFLVGLFAVPESPRWLIQTGRFPEANNIIKRITGHGSFEIPTEKNELGQGSYQELFAPGMRKALVIGLMLPFFSQFSGINAIVFYGPSILNNAGISLHYSLLGQVIFGLANLLFTFVAVWKVDSWGRRPLYVFGTAGAAFFLTATGLCFYFGATSSIWLLISVLGFLACFAFSIGPLKFVVASELFPNAIRGRALAMSVMTMWVADTLVGQITPILLKELGSAYTFWIFASFCLVAFIFVYKWLPETKGKSLEDIGRHWYDNGSAASEFNNK